jgi:hypothetical protein
MQLVMPERQNCALMQLPLPTTVHFKSESNALSIPVSDVDLFSSIPTSDDVMGSNILDELLDMQTDFKIEQPQGDSVDVSEDPMDPWQAVWEQPLSSVGMDFNFDSPSQVQVNTGLHF